MTEPVHPFAAALRTARDAAGLTQAELAAKCGVTVTTVSRWESGSNPPAIKAMRKLRKALPALDYQVKT